MIENSSTIPIRVVFLARLREEFGRAVEDIALPAEVATVGALRAWLAARGEPWARELAPGRAVRIAVNHDVVDADAAVGSGDEIAFFPPVTGG